MKTSRSEDRDKSRMCTFQVLIEMVLNPRSAIDDIIARNMEMEIKRRILLELRKTNSAKNYML